MQQLNRYQPAAVAEVLERHFFNKLSIVFLEWEEVSEGEVQEDKALFVDLAEEDEENVKDQHRTRNILKDRR